MSGLEAGPSRPASERRAQGGACFYCRLPDLPSHPSTNHHHLRHETANVGFGVKESANVGFGVKESANVGLGVKSHPSQLMKLLSEWQLFD